MQEDNNSPKTTAIGGYHNIDEFGFYQSLSKRDFFIILREILISDTKKPLESWTDKAEQKLKKLHKYGIK